MKTMELKEWKETGKELYGEEPINWKWECPACGHVASAKEFDEFGEDPSRAYQNCIGRVNGKGTSNGEDNGYGCNWAAYGLFGTLGKGINIVTEDGHEVEVFEFADVEESL